MLSHWFKLMEVTLGSCILTAFSHDSMTTSSLSVAAEMIAIVTDYVKEIKSRDTSFSLHLILQTLQEHVKDVHDVSVFLVIVRPLGVSLHLLGQTVNIFLVNDIIL